MALSKDEFKIYCLLYAFSLDAGLKKQSLVQLALCVDAEMFVKMYNIFESLDAEGKRSMLENNRFVFTASVEMKEAFLDDLRNTFFLDENLKKMELLVMSLIDELLKGTSINSTF